MAFTPKDWRNYPDTTTPITEAALEDLETRVTAYAEAVLPVHSFKEFSDLSWTSGTADVTDAINDALVSLKSAYTYGALLQLPSGLAVTSDTLVLPLGCGIRGHGMYATRLTIANGSNCDMVTNYQSSDQVEANGMFTSVRDLALHGNSDNQTSGSGIGWNLNPQWTSATNDPDWDCHQLVENVWLFEMKEAGAWSAGRSESRYINVVARYCQGNGFEVGTDNFFHACSAGGNGLAGFKIGGGIGWYLSHCKSFYSGEVTAASGHGFHISDGAKAGVLAGCQAQDNKGYGVLAEGMFGSRLDVSVHSNGRDSAGARPDGVRLVGCYANVIDVVSIEEARNNSVQEHAISLWTSSSGNTIRVAHIEGDSGVITEAVNPNSDSVGGNAIQVNGGATYGGVTAGNSGASFTPEPQWSSVQDVTLNAGTVTINGPTDTPHAGMGMTFILRQDGTGGRAVSFGTADYRVNEGDFTMGTAANNVETVSFVFDGSHWLETGRAAALGTD